MKNKKHFDALAQERDSEIDDLENKIDSNNLVYEF